MYKLTKFLENQLKDYEPAKVIMLGFCSIFLLVAFVGTISATVIETEPKMIDAYKLVIDGDIVCVVEDKELAKETFSLAKERLSDDLNENVLINKNIQLYYEQIEADSELIVEQEELEDKLFNVLVEDKENYKQQVYIIQVGELTIPLENEFEVIEVLNKTKNNYDLEESFEVELISTLDTSNIMTPQITKIEEQEKQSEVLPDLNSESEIESEINEEEIPQGDNYSDDNEGIDSEEESEIEADEEENNEPNIIEMDFVETVQVIIDYELPKNILSVEEAYEIISKENEKQEKYMIDEGDTLSTIANELDIEIDEIMDLNPDINLDTLLQVGQEIIITVPQPEISIIFKEQVTYIEKVPYETEEINDENIYEGTTKVEEAGEEGEKQVTALVSIINGKKTDVEVVDEEVLVEPKKEIVKVGTKALPSTVPTGSYSRPLNGGSVSSPFGMRNGRLHTGVDFRTPTGTTIMASDGGTVIQAGWNGGYGYCITVDHGNGEKTLYAHLSKISVSVGQSVYKNQAIGLSGNTGNSTGPHLHFEIIKNGTYVNPLNYIN